VTKNSTTESIKKVEPTKKSSTGKLSSTVDIYNIPTQSKGEVIIIFSISGVFDTAVAKINDLLSNVFAIFNPYSKKL
jgi:hypothetical protein